MRSEPIIKRISRLAVILAQLQTKQLLTVTNLADQFSVSPKTICSDIRVLQKAGIPVLTEEEIGFILIAECEIPLDILSENQSNALIIAEQLVLKTKDQSFIKDYTEAIEKIKAVLGREAKDKANLISDRTRFDHILNIERTSNNLSELQSALTRFILVEIEYINEEKQCTVRSIEPFALLSTENWLLLAWCRLRNEFRYFRLDRIKKMRLLSETFIPHKMTFQEFMDKYK